LFRHVLRSPLGHSVTELLQIHNCCFAMEGGKIAQLFSIEAERGSTPVS
jgi:hypothetical protein